MCGKGKDTNCQCDGNCQCGKKLPNGEISCHNCGWKAPQAYNALTGNYTCPSCKTESSYNSNNVKPNKNNVTMKNVDPSAESPFSQGLVGLGTGNDGFLLWNQNPIGKRDGNNESSFSQGLVGLGTGNDGFLLWNQKPLGKANGSNESGFADDISSQNMVGYAIGQDWTILDPFNKGGVQESSFGAPLSEEDKQWVDVFNQNTAEFEANNSESGFTFGEKVKNAFTRFTPMGILIRDSYCGKYCKALGYARSADKNAFKRCKASCKINFINAKKGAWTYPAAPEGAVDPGVTPEQLAAQSAKEVASMPPAQQQAATNNAMVEDKQIANSIPDATPPAKSNMMMYIIIGVVVLAIVIAIVIMMRKKAAAVA